MASVTVRSRAGSVALGVLGAIYFISATAIFAYYLVSSWGAMGLIDYVLQAGLVVSAIGGLLFIAIAVRSLGLTPPPAAEKSRSTRDHRTAAATGS